MPATFGRVNEYVYRDGTGKPTHIFWTVNLAAGTTPFIQDFQIEGELRALPIPAKSQVCMLTVRVVTATHGFYRPGRPEFDQLDEAHKAHVLKGGLLCAPLREAIARQEKTDDLPDLREYARWKAFCERVYSLTPPVWGEKEPTCPVESSTTSAQTSPPGTP